MYRLRNDALDGIRLKLRRATEQIGALDAEFIGFRDTKPYQLRPYYDYDRRELSVFEAIREPPPGMWGVQVGEILHNFRSALDHIVWQLVIFETGKEPVTNRTQFPIFRTEKGDKAYEGRGEPIYLKGVGASAKALIKSLQPFSTGEDVKSPLWQLLKLSDFDKHRTLHLTNTSLETGHLNLPDILPGVQVPDYYVRPPGPLENGALLVKARFSGAGWPFVAPEPDMKVEGNLAIRIAFDQGSPEVGGALVIPTLGAIGHRVHETVKRIATEIFKLDL